ncbi:Phytoene synthase protein [Candidatus Micropelagos thuwalensis]|uniref:Phytoene synthase protein n=1 Tax=Candidatus Micropelagius thuwalensis TaxID=1397666 RepID=U2WV64_9PROT|nr:Phytoene synthase protein [Candidatus Micropelagos thuwalensis]
MLTEYAAIKYKKERWALYLVQSPALSSEGAMIKKYIAKANENKTLEKSKLNLVKSIYCSYRQ